MNGRGGVEALFAELEITRGATVQRITDRVSALTGVDIEIDLLGDNEWAAVTRGTLVKDAHARIPVRRSDPLWYRLHVVSHELGHLLCGHSRCETLPMSFEDLRAGTGTFLHTAAGDQEAEAEMISRRLGPLVRLPDFAEAEALFR